jgi:endonuclease/exonuclease/phosphatase (EEP) superfamily protein YafD
MTSIPILLSLALYASALGVGLASCLGFLGRLHWRFELFTHFRLQYAALSAFFAVALLLSGQPAGFYFSLGVTLFNLATILPFYLHRQTVHQPDAKYRILTANILGPNRNYEQISNMLASANPDLALLVEFDDHHQQGLQPIMQSFAHTHYLPRKDNFGLALLSRLPLTSTQIVFLTGDDSPVLVARLELDGKPLTVIGVHPPPPKSQHMTKSRDRQILALAHFAAQQDGEVLLLGDLNTSTWSYAFQDLLRHSGLRNSRLGFGIKPTWPEQMPLMRIPIDHILHSPGIQICHLHTGPFSGSDHCPVVVDFSILTNSDLDKSD